MNLNLSLCDSINFITNLASEYRSASFCFQTDIKKMQAFTCLHINMFSAFHRLWRSWSNMLLWEFSGVFWCFLLLFHLIGTGLGTLIRGEEEKDPQNRTHFILENYTELPQEKNEGFSLILMLAIQYFGFTFLGAGPKLSVDLKTAWHEINKLC